MNEHTDVAGLKAVAVLGVAYAAYPPFMLLSVIAGSIGLAFVTIRGRDYPKRKVAVYVLSCGVLSVPLFLPMVEAYYDNALHHGALTAITIVVTVVTVRFAPITFSVIEDTIPSIIPKILRKIAGVKHD